LITDVWFKTENLPAVGLRAVIPHHAPGTRTLPQTTYSTIAKKK